MKKLTRTHKTKDEKRRLLLTKKNVKQETRMAKYGSDFLAVVAKDVNHRFIAAFMALVFAISCMVVGINFATKADDETIADAIDPNLVTNKTISLNENGTYDLKLEAYANAEVSSQTKTEKIPTDFVVIVDQSGSMAINDMATGYNNAGTVDLETIADGSYYYTDASGNTYRVYAKKGYLYEYYAANTLYPATALPSSAFSWFSTNDDVTFTTKNTFYYKDTDDNAYYQVHFKVQGKALRYHVTPSYTKADGTTITKTAPSKPIYKNVIGALGDLEPGTGWFGADSVTYTTANTFCKALSRTAYTYAEISTLGITTGMYFDFPMYKRYVGYTGLYYRDINGVEQCIKSNSNIEDAEFCNSSGQAVTTEGGSTRMLYSGLKTASGTERRLTALETALNSFVNAVAQETDEIHGTVDNKVAIVGFSSENSSTFKYNNTEVLTGSDIDYSQSGMSSNTSNQYFPYTGSAYTSTNNGSSSGTNYNGPQYYGYSSGEGYTTQVDSTVYSNALINAASGNQDESGNNTVNTSLSNAIKSITAYGGTQPEDGFEMAYQILDQRSTKTFTKYTGEVVDRNTFVIFFTDGEPGNNDKANRFEEANEVVAAANKVKKLQNPKGSYPQVFSIGVFDESDGNPLTYVPVEEDGDYEGYLYMSSSNSEDWIYDEDYVEYKYLWNNAGTAQYYYYLYRAWLGSQPSTYGSTANDTIYDYMSVVSSNYPDATGFVPINSYGNIDGTNYLSDCDTLRSTSTASTTNNYYRMASNQDTLVAAFNQIVNSSVNVENVETTKLDSSAIIKDVIDTNNFVVSDNPVVTVQTVAGSYVDEDNDGTYELEWDNDNPTTLSGATVTWTPSTGDKTTVSVSGFDFESKYVSEPTTANPSGHPGQKVVITIKGLTPVSDAEGVLTSNVGSSSGIFQTVTNNNVSTTTRAATFPEPAITRYKYTLNVDTDATFNVGFTLSPVNGASLNYNNIAYQTDMTDGGTTISTRARYSIPTDSGGCRWTNARNGDDIYIEYITANGTDGTISPSDASLSAAVTASNADASSYTYYLSNSAYVTGENQTSANELANVSPVSLSTTTNGNLYVTSVANNYTVTIEEDVSGPYSSTDNTFSPTLILIPPSGTTVSAGDTLTLATGVTLTGDATNNYYTGTVSNIQGNGSTGAVTLSIPAGYTLKVSQDNSGTYYESPTISYSKSDGTSNNYTDSGIVIDDTTSIIISNASKDSIAPETGISENGNCLSIFMYILAGICAICAVVAFVYTKKRRA